MLYAASELQIFDHVAGYKGDCTTASLAKAHKWKENYTERLLNALVSLKFMDKSPNKTGKGKQVCGHGNINKINILFQNWVFNA